MRLFGWEPNLLVSSPAPLSQNAHLNNVHFDKAGEDAAPGLGAYLILHPAPLYIEMYVSTSRTHLV